MNFKTKYLSIAIAACLAMPAMAQTVSEGEQNGADFIQKIEEGSMGNVIIDIPQNIIDELLKEEPSKKPKNELKPGINKLSGFRIQVFGDGRNQHSLESRARARGNAIVAKFPKYRGQVYSYSSSPNWYTRVGNFRTQAEAAAALAELKSAFPQYAGEMRVVKSQIVVIK